MKPLTIAIIAGAFFALPLPAEAARCPSGYIYRPSQGICQHKAKSIRYTRSKVTRQELRRARLAKREARRARIAAVKARREVVASSYPPPEPPWRTPMFDSMEIERIASSPFGSLIAMPESPAAWAARNAKTFGEN